MGHHDTKGPSDVDEAVRQRVAAQMKTAEATSAETFKLSEVDVLRYKLLNEQLNAARFYVDISERELQRANHDFAKLQLEARALFKELGEKYGVDFSKIAINEDGSIVQRPVQFPRR